MSDGEQRDGRLSIGRFSQMTRLSVKGLRLYAERGLLEPAFVDATSGYRYYDASQALRAEAIRILRSVDMPLDQIRVVLDSGPDTVSARLRAHRETLLARAERSREAAAAVLDVIDGRRALVPYEISTTQLPELCVAAVSVETDLASIGRHIGEGFGAVMAALGEAGCSPTGPPFVIYHDVIDEETPGRIDMCVPTSPGFAGGEAVSARRLPAVDTVSTVHRGRYSDIGPAYHALSVSMQARGARPAGPPREVYLNDPQEAGEGEALTQVLWPIDEPDSATG